MQSTQAPPVGDAAVAALAAVVFGALASASIVIGADDAAGRALLVILLLVAPGIAVAATLPTLEPLGRLVCGLAGALVVNAAVAQTLLSLAVWSTAIGAVAVGVLSVAGWFLALLRNDLQARDSGQRTSVRPVAGGDR